MLSSAGEAGAGHERVHDPCRADRQDWIAEHQALREHRRRSLRLLGWVLPALVLVSAVATIVAGAMAVLRGG